MDCTNLLNNEGLGVIDDCSMVPFAIVMDQGVISRSQKFCSGA
jgi:hypothetical protein